jgi:hypothetical protein
VLVYMSQEGGAERQHEGTGSGPKVQSMSGVTSHHRVAEEGRSSSGIERAVEEVAGRLTRVATTAGRVGDDAAAVLRVVERRAVEAETGTQVGTRVESNVRGGGVTSGGWQRRAEEAKATARGLPVPQRHAVAEGGAAYVTTRAGAVADAKMELSVIDGGEQREADRGVGVQLGGRMGGRQQRDTAGVGHGGTGKQRGRTQNTTLEQHTGGGGGGGKVEGTAERGGKNTVEARKLLLGRPPVRPAVGEGRSHHHGDEQTDDTDRR